MMVILCGEALQGHNLFISWSWNVCLCAMWQSYCTTGGTLMIGLGNGLEKVKKINISCNGLNVGFVYNLKKIVIWGDNLTRKWCWKKENSIHLTLGGCGGLERRVEI